MRLTVRIVLMTLFLCVGLLVLFGSTVGAQDNTGQSGSERVVYTEGTPAELVPTTSVVLVCRVSSSTAIPTGTVCRPPPVTALHSQPVAPTTTVSWVAAYRPVRSSLPVTGGTDWRAAGIGVLLVTSGCAACLLSSTRR